MPAMEAKPFEQVSDQSLTQGGTMPDRVVRLKREMDVNQDKVNIDVDISLCILEKL